MRKLFFVISFLFFSGNGGFFSVTHAFSSDNDSLLLLQEKVQIEVSEEKVSVQLLQKWKNTAQKNEILELWEPLRETVGEVHLFVESEGRNFEILEGRERLMVLAEAGAKNQNPSFFKLGMSQWSKLFHAGVTIPAQQELQIKIVFEVQPDFITDFFFSEIFLENTKCIVIKIIKNMI